MKTIKFKFKWWGLQSIVENYVINNVFYGAYLDTHRAMIAWIAEWYHLSVEECRAYDEKCQLKMKEAHFDLPNS